jgi:hypothetical protein
VGNPHTLQHMDSSLHEVWQAASGSPFLPTVGKGSQFLVAFVLLLLGIGLTGVFALSMPIRHSNQPVFDLSANQKTDRTLVNVPVIGIPASLALAYALSSRRTRSLANRQQIRGGLHVLRGRSLRMRYPKKSSWHIDTEPVP